jgi:hypothetical protein
MSRLFSFTTTTPVQGRTARYDAILPILNRILPSDGLPALLCMPEMAALAPRTLRADGWTRGTGSDGYAVNGLIAHINAKGGDSVGFNTGQSHETGLCWKGITD